jgi:hypothetical protein
MACATGVLANPVIRIPQVSWPEWRVPLPSKRIRAFLMMGLMVSPAFLMDTIGYGVKRLFYTANQVAEMRVPDDPTLAQVNIFHVACADAADADHWRDVATRNGWPMYPEAGPGCFNPDKKLLGIAGLTSFSVACPTLILSVADRQRWMDYAANHNWAAYPQAGPDCVDP